MGHPKIATCCYCGTRAALVLRGEVRHELACAACGAPLHELKSMPVAQEGQPSRLETPAGQPRAKPVRPAKARPRKRKSLSRRVVSEVIDLIEDIFD